MNILTLLILGLGLVVLIISGFWELLFLTFFIYVVSHLYPWLQKIGVWAAKAENLLSLILLAGLLMIVILLASVLLHATLVLLLLVFPILLFFPIDLGILVLGLRLIGWTYNKWRGLLVSIYTTIRLQIIKFKIKVDVQKETDWKIKFEEMKNKLSEEAEQARRKISRRGK